MLYPISRENILDDVINRISTGPLVWLNQSLTQPFAGSVARALSRAQPAVDMGPISTAGLA